MKLANFCRDLWLSHLFFLFNGHLLTKDFMWLKWVNLTLKWMVFFSTVFWRRTVFALLFLNIYLYTHIKIDVSSVSNYFTWWIHYDARSPWCFKWVLQTGHSFQIFMTSAEQRNPQIPLFVEFHQAIPVYGAWARGMITGHFGRKMDAGCGFQHAR